ncbi:ThiF family adenylyltransferase [Paenibacillus sp. sptzw28]|uniref:ThiF family adenylyltransferase n=1 Tax=Paenibacillus sp. sptzw28 TaxID=715179 RepID=UPI0021627B58|nr:ThiF family adenylyltransferase [Paenibacillus sp. sptzw28]
MLKPAETQVNPDREAWSDRYSRQIRFMPIGASGQTRLADACVLIVGSGALGASLAQHMVRAGIGTVRLADRDFVELSNLQRQMLFEEADALAALPKAVAAADKLRRINSSVNIEPFVVDVTAEVADQLAAGAHLVLDGTDNAATRLLLSGVCFRLGIPFLYGGVAGSQGMSAVLVPGETACLRCLIGGADEGEAGETCDTIGVISPIVEWIAALQAAEALKWLSGNRDALRRTWLTADLWPFRVHESALPLPTAGCPCCGEAAAASGREVNAAGEGRTAVAERSDQAQAAVAEPASDQAQAAVAKPKADQARPAAAEPASGEGRTAAGVGRAAMEPVKAAAEAAITSEAATEKAAESAALSAQAADTHNAARSGARIITGAPAAASAESQPQTVTLCGRDTVQVTLGRAINLSGMQSKAASLGCAVTSNPYLVRAQVPEGQRLVLFPDGRVLVQGTQDIQLAISLCTRYITGTMAEQLERSE